MPLLDTISILLTATVVYAGTLAVFILMKIRKDISRFVDWTIKKETYSSVTLNENFLKISSKIRAISEYEDYRSLTTSQKEEIIMLLGLCEDISIGVRSGIFDEDIVKESMNHLFRHTFHTLKEYIYRLRSEHASPSYYENYEFLVRKWESKEGGIS
ncbi:DUF4760 domain-containing protein [Coraliomargarita sp. SDUM461003]|uniref:DUF4760 domain-containing protein n=1 Tax=Thalassobacterium maritimum TaxID=3041265 RepID=A0ABU1AZV4_9BACT|nr:DUF4760 domain-containing protein [Coraliomargarita sp. SDUM461003]MDQ8209652.1 DUF4760 domain-containing protein [Coraliomargarita sp. SDUM461003]